LTALNVRILADGGVSERSVDLERGLTYEGLFELLKINSETVVALWNGHPVPADELVEPGRLEIVRIVSSG